MKSTAHLLLVLFRFIAAHEYGESSFQVQDYIAGSTPHSSDGYADLNFGFSPDSSPSTCHAEVPSYQVFPSVPWTTCSDYRTAFALTKTSDGGAELQLSYQTGPGSYTNGTHKIAPDEIIWINQDSPNGKVQVYVGPPNFSVNEE
ncbi:hypothetical protein PG996_006369 [Apiospora saccharicola]|uniref:Uncharacterized protein n=1 Tax=Apiospora saccharicola TaxID=335842 RepID=A0ABR1VP50_9PEZI